VLKDAIEDARAELAVVVVPSRVIKGQWVDSLEKVGLRSISDIDNSTLDERRKRGMELFDPARPVQIVTYQQVAANSEVFQVLCARHQVFLVFDEIHHADDDETFGEALRNAFEDSVFKLSLSGTPFNTRGGRLAFCEVEQVVEDGAVSNRTKADFTYSYGEALAATGDEDDPRVVRTVAFVRWKGRAEWIFRDIKTGEENGKHFDGTRKTDLLGPLIEIDDSSHNLRKMLAEAVADLDRVRSHHRNAGGLITARDTEHCDQIAEVLSGLGVKDHTIVRYDTPRAVHEIEHWARGNERWLIAIKMISEGVDITRLRVGVYASNVLTRMFFTQFVGRFIRWDKSLAESQFATIYIPYHVTLIRYAEEIERMIDSQPIDQPTPGPTGGVQTRKSVLIGKASDGETDGGIERGEFFEESLRVRVASIQAQLDFPISPRGILEILKADGQSIAGTGGRFTEDERSLGKQNDRMVNRIASVAKRVGLPWDYKTINNAANNAVGIERKDKLTPESTLRSRLEFLKGLLLQVYREAENGKNHGAESRSIHGGWPSSQ
jgi:superfamily II DNA or RNA helicase